MACGKPLVSFNNSSNPEVIINGETGFLAEPGNIDDLVEKILILAENSTLRDEMGKKGRNLVAERFSLKASLEKLEKLIKGK